MKVFSAFVGGPAKKAQASNRINGSSVSHTSHFSTARNLVSVQLAFECSGSPTRSHSCTYGICHTRCMVLRPVLAILVPMDRYMHLSVDTCFLILAYAMQACYVLATIYID